MNRRSSVRWRDVWVYGLLISGSIIFSWPFLWMAATLVKTNRETFAENLKLWPRVPRPPMQSLYVDTRFYSNAAGSKANQLRDAIERRLRAMDYPWPRTVDRETAIRQVARGIFKKLSLVLPPETWQAPLGVVAREAETRVTPALVADTLSQILRKLRLGSLTAQSFDLAEDALVPPDHLADSWRIAGTGNASLIAEPGEPVAVLQYDFSRGERVTLSGRFTTSFPVDRLHRLKLIVGSDDSYHTLTASVEKLGVLYKSERTYDLADFTTAIVTWQQASADDLTARARNWTLLREVDRGPGYESDPHKLKFTLELRRNSPPGALWAKIRRNYRLVFDTIPFWNYAANSVFLVILNIAGTLFSCSLVAYGFARIQWPGRNLCFVVMLATMMVPAQVTMIPHFLIMKRLGWYDTLYPLWVTSFFASAFSVFLLRQFMKGIPRDLEDAARIDGCGFWRIYWHIMVPLSKPALAVIAIFTFLASWNDFMGPLIYLNDQRLYPLSLGLYALNVAEGGPNTIGMMMAASLLMTLPVIVTFILAQKYFLHGAKLTGMKA